MYPTTFPSTNTAIGENEAVKAKVRIPMVLAALISEKEGLWGHPLAPASGVRLPSESSFRLREYRRILVKDRILTANVHPVN